MTWEKCRARKAFTIIEVMLFLAVTGLLFIGLTVGLGSNVTRQRYNDAVEDITRIIQTQYNRVTRTEISSREDSDICTYILNGRTDTDSTKRGRSSCDVYGVAVAIGVKKGSGTYVQTTTLIGEDYADFKGRFSSSDGTDFDTYYSSNLMMLFKDLRITNVYTKGASSQVTEVLSNDKVKWGATLQYKSKVRSESSYRDIRAILMIIRSPRDGVVHTYVYDFTTDNTGLQLTDFTTDTGDAIDDTKKIGDISKLITSSYDAIARGASSSAPLRMEKLVMCVGSDDVQSTSKTRRTIKIIKDGHSSSAVLLLDTDIKSDFDNNTTSDELLDDRCDK